MSYKSDLGNKVLEPLRESDWGDRNRAFLKHQQTCWMTAKGFWQRMACLFSFKGFVAYLKFSDHDAKWIGITVPDCGFYGYDIHDLKARISCQTHYAFVIEFVIWQNGKCFRPQPCRAGWSNQNQPFHKKLEWPEEGTWDQCQAAELNTDSSFLVPWPSPCAEYPSSQSRGYPSWSMPFGGVIEDRSASSSKSHSQAEKRRRDRINAQLATLRKLIPKSDKMDKAALLGSVVEHVKDLKRKALEVSKSVTVPTEVDEVTIDYFYLDQDKTEENIFIKASVCCDDRPELFAELTQALRGLKLTTVRADMASLGGRIKSILVLCTKDGKEGVCVNTVVQSLKGVLSRIAAASTASSYRMRSKRQRFFLPSH